MIFRTPHERKVEEKPSRGRRRVTGVQ